MNESTLYESTRSASIRIQNISRVIEFFFFFLVTHWQCIQSIFVNQNKNINSAVQHKRFDVLFVVIFEWVSEVNFDKSQH